VKGAGGKFGDTIIKMKKAKYAGLIPRVSGEGGQNSKVKTYNFCFGWGSSSSVGLGDQLRGRRCTMFNAGRGHRSRTAREGVYVGGKGKKTSHSFGSYLNHRRASGGWGGTKWKGADCGHHSRSGLID